MPALVAAVVHANTLANGWAGDDPSTLELVAEHPGIWRAFGPRFVTYAVHAFDLWLWPGSAAGAHATNVALHVIATGLCASAARRLANSPSVGMLCGLLFAVHPVHVEAVASFANRKDLLAMIFVMLALHCWLARSRPGIRLFGAPIFLLLGLFSKEVAAIGAVFTLPAASLVVAERRGSVARMRSARLWIAVGAIVLVLLGSLGAWSIAGDARRFFSGPMIRETIGTTDRYGEVAARAFASFPGAVRLLFHPADLSIDYPPPTPGALPVVGGALLVAACIAATVALLRRAPVDGYAWLWVLVMYLPVSNLIPLTEFFLADRYLYVPSFGVCLGLALVIVRLARAIPSDRKALRLAGALVLGAVFVAGAARSIQRNRDWRNQWTLHAAALSDGFETARVDRGVGYSILAHGFPDEALVRFRKALALDPRLAFELASPMAAARLLARSSEALRVPSDAAGLDLVAKALSARGRHALAIELLETAVREDPRYGRDLAWILAAHPGATAEQIARAERVALESAAWPSTPRDRAFALCGAALARTRMGDFNGAADLARRALDLTQAASDRWMASVAQVVLSGAQQSRPMVLPGRLLFGVLWKTHFADFGEPECHRGFSFRVLRGEVSFDSERGALRGNLLVCERLPLL